MSHDFRFAITGIILAGTALFLNIHHRSEVVPTPQPLGSIPRQLGPWHGKDIPISTDVLDTLGNGDFLSRAYSDDVSKLPSINLFMAYLPTQRTGDSLHSPGNCLPGTGWFPLEAGKITLSAAGHAPFEVKRFYIAKGSDRALVLYWYWAHGRGVASEFWAKFYMVADAIRLNRSDGALIRLTAPVRSGQSTADVEQALIAFSRELVPIIDSYVPR